MGNDQLICYIVPMKHIYKHSRDSMPTSVSVNGEYTPRVDGFRVSLAWVSLAIVVPMPSIRTHELSRAFHC